MDLHFSQLLIDLLLGAALGYVAGLFGIGGGLLAIPLFTLGYGMDQQIAQGTALVLMTPNMVIGFWRYRQRNPITLTMGALLAAGSTLTSYFSALLAAYTPTHTLRLLFAVFIGGLALSMLWRNFGRQAKPNPRKPLPQWTLILAGGIGGACAGFFTIGGGIVTVPILTAFFGLAQTSAQGLILAMLAPGSLAALVAYAQMGLVQWATAIPITLASALTVSHGVTLAHRWPERRLRAAFSLVLLGAALMLILR